jgi:hypothetical protein
MPHAAMQVHLDQPLATDLSPQITQKFKMIEAGLPTGWKIASKKGGLGDVQSLYTRIHLCSGFITSRQPS